MSCAPGKPCEEGIKRKRALLVLGTMAAFFLALSAASFLPDRVQALPSKVHYDNYDAIEGKRIFQAYNCMGCHTIVGNGAYLGPDLTKLYNHVGPAYLEAFLPSAGAWPGSGAVKLQLQNSAVQADAGTDDFDAYVQKFPGAAERIRRRGGQKTLMPNLPITREEAAKLIAFLKYTSEMNTEGWPPKPKIDGVAFIEARKAAATATAAATPAAAAAAAPAGGAELGHQLAEDNGCLACHSAGTDKLVGPGWSGLYGSQVALADGKSLTADDAYIAESITHPDAKVVAGYQSGVMPSYADLLDQSDVDAIVAYIRSLGGK